MNSCDIRLQRTYFRKNIFQLYTQIEKPLDVFSRTQNKHYGVSVCKSTLGNNKKSQDPVKTRYDS